MPGALFKKRGYWYAPILGFAMGLMMVRLLVLARLISVDEYGILSYGLLITSTYLMLSCLGMQLNYQKNSPLLLSTGMERKSIFLMTQAIVIAGVLFILGILILLMIGPRSHQLERIAYLGLINGLCQQIFIIATVDQRSRGNIFAYSLSNLYRAILIVLLSSISAYFFDSAAIALAVEIFITSLFSIVIIYRIFNNLNKYKKAFIVTSIKTLKRINWGTNLSYFFIALAGFLVLNIDRWLASHNLTIENFSKYSFLAIVLVISSSIQAIINTSFFPNLVVHYTKKGRCIAYNSTLKISSIVFISFGLCCLIGFIYQENILRFLAPKYSDVFDCTWIFLLIGLLRASDFWQTYLIVIKKHNVVLAINILIILLNSIFLIFSNIFVSIYSIALMALSITFELVILSIIFSWVYRNE